MEVSPIDFCAGIRKRYFRWDGSPLLYDEGALGYLKKLRSSGFCGGKYDRIYGGRFYFKIR